MYARVRQGPAHEAQHRHRAGGCSRCSTTTGGSPSCSTRCCSRMPGSPVLYYGDEIGMGDNIYLGDRDGVRTPMQWTPDRNAGFSQRRLRPAVPAAADGPGVRLPGGQRRGARLRNPVSFLHWVRRMLAGPQASTRCSASARFEVLVGREPVGARLPAPRDVRRRARGHRAVRQQPQPLRAAGRAACCAASTGKMPVELLGRVPFPPIGELPYFVTLAAVRLLLVHAAWTTGDRTDDQRRRRSSTLLPDFLRPPALVRRGDRELVDGRGRRLRGAARRAGPALLGARRRCSSATATTPRYQVLVGLRPLDADRARSSRARAAALLGDVDTDAGPALVYDALVDPELALALLRHVAPDEHGRARAAAQRRAVEHVGRLRRAADPEAVPPAAPTARTPMSRSPRRWPTSASRTSPRRSATWRRDGDRPRRRARVPRRRHRGLAARAHVAARPVRQRGVDPAEARRRLRARGRPARRRSPRSCTWRWPRRSAPTTATPTAWADDDATPARRASRRRALDAHGRSTRGRTTRCATSTTRARPSASTATTTSAR